MKELWYGFQPAFFVNAETITGQVVGVADDDTIPVFAASHLCAEAWALEQWVLKSLRR